MQRRIGMRATMVMPTAYQVDTACHRPQANCFAANDQHTLRAQAWFALDGGKQQAGQLLARLLRPEPDALSALDRPLLWRAADSFQSRAAIRHHEGILAVQSGTANISCSIDIAFFPEHGLDAETLHLQFSVRASRMRNSRTRSSCCASPPSRVNRSSMVLRAASSCQLRSRWTISSNCSRAGR